MKIEKEDYEQWLAHPVTEWFFAAHRILAERTKQKWIEQSWDGGNPDPLMLADLRARAEVVKDLCELKHDDIEEVFEDEQSERRAPNGIQGSGATEAS